MWQEVHQASWVPWQVYSGSAGLLKQAPHPHAPFPQGKHDLLVADAQVRLLTADGVDALEAPLQIVAGLLQGARVVPVLALVDV